MRTTISMMFFCIVLSFSVRTAYGQLVTFGEWEEEGSGSLDGFGDTFAAFPTASGIADNGDNFDERNLARHRVFQLFDQAIDFSAEGDEVHIDFDVTFNSMPENLDSDFRMSLVDTSTNQGFYPLSFDIGTRSGTYNRIRFIDNLDGEVGTLHGGLFTDAINGSGTIAQSADAPMLFNGATDAGLTDGNRVSFSVVLTRNAGNSFDFSTNATEQEGDVVYPEISGSYDPVNPTSGDTTVANIAINSFDGVVFGLFDDDPFASNPDGAYEVANIRVADFPFILGDINRDRLVGFLDISPFITVLAVGGFQPEADTNGDRAVDFLDISPFIILLSN